VTTYPQPQQLNRSDANFDFDSRTFVNLLRAFIICILLNERVQFLGLTGAKLFVQIMEPKLHSKKVQVSELP